MRTLPCRETKAYHLKIKMAGSHPSKGHNNFITKGTYLRKKVKSGCNAKVSVN